MLSWLHWGDVIALLGFFLLLISTIGGTTFPKSNLERYSAALALLSSFMVAGGIALLMMPGK